MPKLICHYKKNEKGSWDLHIVTIQDGVEASSYTFPHSRTTGVNRMLATLWRMKPGDDFTITTEWEDK